ncbi:MAG: sialate O-acetylesterase [Flavobacterium sp.]|uniref:sialate O-acetylesterase n=1 Tax=Flavobacterium sp. TaxID=239 RepID=UPI003BD2D6AD
MRNSILAFQMFFLFYCNTATFAKIKLPSIIASNMVLQRNTTVKIWGWANPSEKITIKTSWISEALKVTTPDNGRWEIAIKTTLSKEPQTIQLKSSESTINIENIVFGEVWICSGQSNMRMPLKGYTGQPTFDGNSSIATAKNINLRLFSITENGSPNPLDSVSNYKKWSVSSPETVKDFSAVAYFYGKQLQEILDVPVGLIMTSWGGTRIQPWMSKEAVAPFLDVNKVKKDTTDKYKRIPSAIFNAMINPITSYTIKGALWYQGETNRDEPNIYQKLLPEMVKDWRKEWNIGDFPFYYVQIAPNKYIDKSNSQYLREAQLKVLEVIPNSGMAVLSDIGSDATIHPPRKKEVAERLLFLALNKTYGMKDVDCTGPIYKSMSEKEGALLLSFDAAETGIFSPETELSNFEIAGEDKIFYPAKAEIIAHKQLKVSSLDVKVPVAVRYGWKNWFVGTLYDNNMLPASSFRTDDWE